MFLKLVFDTTIFLSQTGGKPVFTIQINSLRPNVSNAEKLAFLACVAISGIDIHVLISGKDKQFPEDDKIKEFFYCLAMKLDMATEDGLIKEDKFLKKINELDPAAAADVEDMKKIIEKCQHKDGKPKDNIFKFVNCYMEKMTRKLSQG